MRKTDPKNPKHKDYAVIYGANNPGSKSFAKYLAKRGFHIILVEKDRDSLEKVKAEI